MLIKHPLSAMRRRPGGPGFIWAAGLLLAACLLLASGAGSTGAAAPGQTAATPAPGLPVRAAFVQGKMAGHWPLTIPAAEFASTGGDNGSYGFSQSGGYIRPYSDPGQPIPRGVCLRAPVELPDGVRVDQLTAYVYDSDRDGDVSRIELWRAPFRATVGGQLMAATASSGFGGNVIQALETTAVVNPMVDNSQFSYYALVCLDGTTLGGTLRLYALTLTFSLNNYLPLISSRE